jgi:hypothetical protein
VDEEREKEKKKEEAPRSLAHLAGAIHITSSIDIYAPPGGQQLMCVYIYIYMHFLALAPASSTSTL